jgi:hypothetical protein
MAFSMSRSYSLHLTKTIILTPLLLGIGMTDSAFAQDRVATSPPFYKVLLENDRARVVENIGKTEAPAIATERRQ